MRFLESLVEHGQNVHKKITKPKFVKISTTIALIVMVTLMFIGVIVAQFDPAGPETDKAGFNIIENYISDLGNHNFTPFPYFLDIASIVSGLLLIPTLFYMERLIVIQPEKEKAMEYISRMKKRMGTYWIAWMLAILIGYISIGIFLNRMEIYYYLAFPSILWISGLVMLIIPFPKNRGDLEKKSRIRLRFGIVAFLFMLSGLIGWFLVGVFSEDRSTYYYIHFYASILCFSGLALGSLFFGFIITFYETPFPKYLGLYALIVPIIPCIALIMTLMPIIEWIFFFSVFGWMIPGFIFLIKLSSNELND